MVRRPLGSAPRATDGNGVCHRAVDVRQLGNSGSANSSYDYSLHATDSSGNWAWSGSNTYDEHDYGGDQYTYSGSGSYSRNFDPNNVGTLKGTTAGSGDGNDSDDYSSHYTLCTASGSSYGQWQPASGSGTATAGYHDYSSFAGSGAYRRSNSLTGDRYLIHGTASEGGSGSDSGSCTTNSQLGSSGWITSGTGSTSSSSSASYSYSGGGNFASDCIDIHFESHASENGNGSTSCATCDVLGWRRGLPNGPAATWATRPAARPPTPTATTPMSCT